MSKKEQLTDLFGDAVELASEKSPIESNMPASQSPQAQAEEAGSKGTDTLEPSNASEHQTVPNAGARSKHHPKSKGEKADAKGKDDPLPELLPRVTPFNKHIGAYIEERHYDEMKEYCQRARCSISQFIDAAIARLLTEINH